MIGRPAEPPRQQPVTAADNPANFCTAQASHSSRDVKEGDMKVYVHFEEGSDAELHVTLKLTLPKKWNDESPVKLLKVDYCRTAVPLLRDAKGQRRSTHRGCWRYF